MAGRIRPPASITSLQHALQGEKGIRLRPSFKLLIKFPPDIEADMVTVIAQLRQDDMLSSPVTDPDGIALTQKEVTSSRLLRINASGEREFEVEFNRMSINRAGRFCVRFDVDYFCRLQPRRFYGLRHSYNFFVVNFSFS